MTETVLPHDLQLEEAVLGAVLLSNTAIPRLAVDLRLTPEAFYRTDLGQVWRGMLELSRAGEPVDELTIRRWLIEHAGMEPDRAAVTVNALPAAPPAVGAVLSYAEKVIELAEWRRVATAGVELTAAVQALDIDRRRTAEGLLPASAYPKGADLAVRTADLAVSRPPEWAWSDRIVLGALNLIVGVEGAGKGTLACWLFAKLTLGQLPGNLYSAPSTIAIIGDEDGFAGVWTPRLHAAGADLARVKLIERGDGGLIELTADRDRLAEIVSAEDIKLLYLDALTDNLGAGIDDWKAKQVREALAPARYLARELNVAVVGSLHPNKGGGSFRQFVAGSFAFNALSRSSLLLAQHPDDEDRRVLVRGKGNLSATPEAVEFAIESHKFEANGHRFDVPRAVNFTTSALTSEDVLGHSAAPAPAGEARTDARDLIAAALADGDWHAATPIIEQCEQAGIYKRAAQRAADDLGVEKERRGFPATSHWRLSRQGTTSGIAVTPVTTVTSEQAALSHSNDRDDRHDTDDSRAGCHHSVTTDIRPLNALTADCEADQ